VDRAAILGYKNDHDFEHSPRASWPRREGWDGYEESTVEFHIRMELEFVKEIGDFLDG
jgi:hypothetical protein